MGWDRYDTPQAAEAMNGLYRNELRLRLNLFQPSAKLMKRVRMGSKLRRRYDLPCTPLDRLAAGEPDQATVRTQLAPSRNFARAWTRSSSVAKSIASCTGFTLSRTRV